MISAGAVALAACQPKPVADGGPELTKLLDAFFNELLDASPQFATQTGLDKDARAAAKGQLDGASLADLAKNKALNADQLRRISAFDRASVSGARLVDYDSTRFELQATEDGNHFQYGGVGAGNPYVVSQLNGAYQAIPDFLGTQHTVETKGDADAYLARLAGFAALMDQESERVRHDVALGVIPPDFAIDKALGQMKGLLEPATRSPLVRSVADRAKEKGVPGDYEGQAAKIYQEQVVPALQRQIDLMTELRGKAVHDAGIWRLPEGEAYYAAALKSSTTTTLKPDEIHQMGLEQARILGERADTLLKSQGYTQGTVGERIRGLFDDPKYRYPDTDAAKEKLIADLNAQVKAMNARLPSVIGAFPKASVEVRRVPKFIEAGAPGGYYNQPTLDGTRPGIYWINLRDTAENPTWSLPTLTYHEATPGHHNQVALAQEADLPMLRRVVFNSAYVEGWALYAEQLADEMGVYENDPLGAVGYLQSALFRSARLVVDTGMHAKRWSREQAIKTMTSIDGSQDSAATTEIERYCVWPGQACSYMVGKLTWVRLREKAKAALGPRFDLKKFHDTALLAGSTPLTVLESVVDSYIAAAKA